MIASIIEALVLGVVQGLTEFLPVSSSGHLEIAKALFGNERLPEESLALTVLLHLGTALATLGVFRKDVFEIISGLTRPGPERNFSLYILISMIPAGLIGYFFEDSLSYFFGGELALVGLALLVTGGLLFFSERKESGSKPVYAGSAWWIGMAQAFALLPGISRSGATISMALFLGIDRSKAARFSFLMVVPLILGKIAKDMLGGDMAMAPGEWVPAMVGLVAAFASGWWACVWMISLVKRAKLSYFAYYCWVIGLVAIFSSFL